MYTSATEGAAAHTTEGAPAAVAAPASARVAAPAASAPAAVAAPAASAPASAAPGEVEQGLPRYVLFWARKVEGRQADVGDLFLSQKCLTSTR